MQNPYFYVSFFSFIGSKVILSEKVYVCILKKKKTGRNFNKNKRKIMVLRFLFSVNLIKCDKGAYSVGFLG